MESKGLKVNVGKTKVMVGGDSAGIVPETHKWPCGVCGKGVGSNSLQCHQCKQWVQKRCTKIKGGLAKASASFTCSICLGGVQQASTSSNDIEIDSGMKLEKVTKFCYLGDMLDAKGGADLAITTRIRCAWGKFGELTPFLTSKGVSLRMKGQVYRSCVRSVMIYGSETWPMKKEHENRLNTTEMRMIRWMSGVSLRDRKSSKELRDGVGVEEITEVCRRSRLRWFGHVERKEDDDWVKKCTVLEVEGKRPRGRPKRTWNDVVGDDMKRLQLLASDAKDRVKWKRVIHNFEPANQGSP